MRIHAGLALSARLSLGCCARAQSLPPTFITIYNFPACAGSAPCIGVGPDSIAIGFSGVLYGTTLYGGPYDAGTLFSLTLPSTPGGLWTPTVLYNLGSDKEAWAGPVSLAIGSGGVLYGMTLYGDLGPACYYELGSSPDCGAVFSLTPPSAPAGAWTEALVAQGYNVTPLSFAIGSGGIIYAIISGVVSCQTDFPGTLPTCSSSTGTALYSVAPPATPTATWTTGGDIQYRHDRGGVIYLLQSESPPARQHQAS